AHCPDQRRSLSMNAVAISPARTLRAAVLCGLGLLGLAAAAAAQAPGRSSDEFSLLFPSRVKTFVKAGYDPDDRIDAPFRGNDDGFSGQNGNEAYRTVDSGQPLSVLAHFEGRPGVLGLFFRNFWSDSVAAPLFAGENNRTRFWLDGALRYDLPLTDCF